MFAANSLEGDDEWGQFVATSPPLQQAHPRMNPDPATAASIAAELKGRSERSSERSIFGQSPHTNGKRTTVSQKLVPGLWR